MLVAPQAVFSMKNNNFKNSSSKAAINPYMTVRITLEPVRTRKPLKFEKKNKSQQ